MANRRPTVVSCPTCGKAVEWTPDNPWRPFCCERCRLIDLGEWFEERHRIPAEPDEPGTTDWEPGDRD
ncbi:MAG TPA: DNA gyrase inhibitor YacG [Gammaproteobacteria bacterium]|nr:DNA gyrase inhibitor YacG [Gammaproteobacteria bacterium]